MHRLFIIYTIVVTLSLPCAANTTNKMQSLSKLKQVATDFLAKELEGKVSGRVEVNADNIDPRLRLPHCPEKDITVYMPEYVQNISKATVVGVRCNVGSKWSVYVPVDVDIYTKLVTLKHAVSLGHIITNNDLSVVEYDTNNVHQGFFQDINQVVGKAAKRNLLANVPVTHHDLIIPDIIKRGDSVMISAEFGRIRVQAQGQAMNGGSMGETISVKNTSSGKVLQARVIGPKKVKIAG